VIELVSAAFVPVWINIRTEPLPDLECLREVMEGVALDGERHVTGGFNRGFFLRSVVLDKDGETLLNPQPSRATLGQLFSNGHFAYAQVKPRDYLAMLREARVRADPGGR